MERFNHGADRGKQRDNRNIQVSVLVAVSKVELLVFENAKASETGLEKDFARVLQDKPCELALQARCSGSPSALPIGPVRRKS